MGSTNNRLSDADLASANAERYFKSNYRVRLVPGLNQLFSGIREIPQLHEVPHEKDPRRLESERREDGLRESRNALPLKTVELVDIGEDDWRPMHRIKIPPTRGKLPSKIRNIPNSRDPRRQSAKKRANPEDYQSSVELPTLVQNECIPEEEETCAVLVIDSSDWPNSKHCWIELIPHECNVARALLDVQDIMSDDGEASMRRDNAESDEPMEVNGESDLFQGYSQAAGPRSPPRGASEVKYSDIMTKSFDIRCVFYDGESLRRRRISDPQIIEVKEDVDIDEIVYQSSRPVPRTDGELVDIVDLSDDDEPVLPNKQSTEYAKKAQWEATRAALEVVTLDDEDDYVCDPSSAVNDLNFMSDSSDELRPWLDATDVVASSTLTNNAAECLSSTSRDDAIGFTTNFDASPKSTSSRLNTDDLLHVPKSKYRRSHFASKPATSDQSSRVTIIDSGPVVNNESRAASRDKPDDFQEHWQREPRDFAAAAERRADGSQSRREKSRGRSHKNRSENQRNVATAHNDRRSRFNYSPTFKSHSSVDEIRRKSSSDCSDAKTKHYSHSRHEKNANSAERDNRRCRESRERANVPVELDSGHSRNEIARHSKDKERPRNSKTDDSKKRERPKKKDKKDREDKSAGERNRHSLPAPSVPSRKENKEQTATSAIKKTEERTATSTIKKNEERTEKSAIKKNEEQTATSAIKKNEECTAKSAIKKNKERTATSTTKKNEERTEKSAIKKNEEQTATSAIKKNDECTAKFAIKKNKERTATSATNKIKEQKAKSTIRRNRRRSKQRRTKQINAITRADLLFSMLGTAGSRKGAPAFGGPQQPQLALTAPIVAQQQNAFMPLTCTVAQPMCTSVPLIKATSQSPASLPLTCVAARPMSTSVPLIGAASHSTALLPISNTAAPPRLTPMIITSTQDNQQLTLSFSVNSELLSDICRPWARECLAGGPSRLRTHELTRVQPYGHRVTINFDLKTHFQHGVAMKARGHRFVHCSQLANSCLRLLLNNNSHMPLHQLLQVDERVKSGEIFWSRYNCRLQGKSDLSIQEITETKDCDVKETNSTKSSYLPFNNEDSSNVYKHSLPEPVIGSSVNRIGENFRMISDMKNVQQRVHTESESESFTSETNNNELNITNNNFTNFKIRKRHSLPTLIPMQQSFSKRARTESYMALNDSINSQGIKLKFKRDESNKNNWKTCDSTEQLSIMKPTTEEIILTSHNDDKLNNQVTSNTIVVFESSSFDEKINSNLNNDSKLNKNDQKTCSATNEISELKRFTEKVVPELDKNDFEKNYTTVAKDNFLNSLKSSFLQSRVKNIKPSTTNTNLKQGFINLQKKSKILSNTVMMESKPNEKLKKTEIFDLMTLTNYQSIAISSKSLNIANNLSTNNSNSIDNTTCSDISQNYKCTKSFNNHDCSNYSNSLDNLKSNLETGDSKGKIVSVEVNQSSGENFECNIGEKISEERTSKEQKFISKKSLTNGSKLFIHNNNSNLSELQQQNIMVSLNVDEIYLSQNIPNSCTSTTNIKLNKININKSNDSDLNNDAENMRSNEIEEIITDKPNKIKTSQLNAELENDINRYTFDEGNQLQTELKDGDKKNDGELDIYKDNADTDNLVNFGSNISENSTRNINEPNSDVSVNKNEKNAQLDIHKTNHSNSTVKATEDVTVLVENTDKSETIDSQVQSPQIISINENEKSRNNEESRDLIKKYSISKSIESNRKIDSLYTKCAQLDKTFSSVDMDLTISDQQKKNLPVNFDTVTSNLVHLETKVSENTRVSNESLIVSDIAEFDKESNNKLKTSECGTSNFNKIVQNQISSVDTTITETSTEENNESNIQNAKSIKNILLSENNCIPSNNHKLNNLNIENSVMNVDQVLPDSTGMVENLEGGDFDFHTSIHTGKLDSDYDDYYIDSDCSPENSSIGYTSNIGNNYVNEDLINTSSPNESIGKLKNFQEKHNSDVMIETQKIDSITNDHCLKKLPQFYNHCVTKIIDDTNEANITNDVIFNNEVDCDIDIIFVEEIHHAINTKQNTNKIKEENIINLDPDDEKDDSNVLQLNDITKQNVNKIKEENIINLDSEDDQDDSNVLQLNAINIPTRKSVPDKLEVIEKSQTEILKNKTEKTSEYESNQQNLPQMKLNFSDEISECVIQYITSLSEEEIENENSSVLLPKVELMQESNSCNNKDVGTIGEKKSTEDNESTLSQVMNDDEEKINSSTDKVDKCNTVHFPEIQNQITNVEVSLEKLTEGNENSLSSVTKNDNVTVVSSTDGINKCNVVHFRDVKNRVSNVEITSYDKLLSDEISQFPKNVDIDLNNLSILQKFNLSKEVIAPEDTENELVTVWENNSEQKTLHDSLNKILEDIAEHNDSIPSSLEHKPLKNQNIENSENQVSIIINSPERKSTVIPPTVINLKISNQPTQLSNGYNLLNDLNVNLVDEIDEISDISVNNSITMNEQRTNSLAFKLRNINELLQKPQSSSEINSLTSNSVIESSNSLADSRALETQSNTKCVTNFTKLSNEPIHSKAVHDLQKTVTLHSQFSPSSVNIVQPITSVVSQSNNIVNPMQFLHNMSQSCLVDLYSASYFNRPLQLNNINKSNPKVVLASSIFTNVFDNNILSKTAENSTNDLNKRKEHDIYTLELAPLDTLKLPVPFTVNAPEAIVYDHIHGYKTMLFLKIINALKLLKEVTSNEPEKFVEALENKSAITENTWIFQLNIITVIQCIACLKDLSKAKNTSIILKALLNTEPLKSLQNQIFDFKKVINIFLCLQNGGIISKTAANNQPLYEDLHTLCCNNQINLPSISNNQKEQIKYQAEEYYKIYNIHCVQSQRTKSNNKDAEKQHNPENILRSTSISSKQDFAIVTTASTTQKVSESFQESSSTNTSKEQTNLDHNKMSNTISTSDSASSSGITSKGKKNNSNTKTNYLIATVEETNYHVCENCKKSSKLLCSRCKEASYCSEECQATHWTKEHHKSCLLTTKDT